VNKEFSLLSIIFLTNHVRCAKKHFQMVLCWTKFTAVSQSLQRLALCVIDNITAVVRSWMTTHWKTWGVVVFYLLYCNNITKLRFKMNTFVRILKCTSCTRDLRGQCPNMTPIAWDVSSVETVFCLAYFFVKKDPVELNFFISLKIVVEAGTRTQEYVDETFVPPFTGFFLL
jgi:hypothetical protein